MQMRFSSCACKELLQDCSESKPNLALARGHLDEIDKFSYLGSCISPAGHKSDEVFLRIWDLKQIWRLLDIRLSIQGRVYAVAVRLVLPYSSGT